MKMKYIQRNTTAMNAKVKDFVWDVAVSMTMTAQ